MTKEQCQEKINQINFIFGEFQVAYALSNFKGRFDWNKSRQYLQELESHFEGLLKVYDIQDESNNNITPTGISG